MNNVSNFRAAISHLRKRTEFPQDWLKAFESESFDEQVSKRIASATERLRNGETPFPFEPLHVEALLGDMAVLLDRCHSYRREIAELELLAYKSAADHVQTIRNVELERIAIQTPPSASELTQKVDTLRSAAKSLAQGDQLGKGMALFCEAEANYLASAATGAAMRRESASKKLDELLEVANAAQARHVTPGNAHNFVERSARIMTLALEDIEEAYLKAESARAGMRIVFGYEKPFNLGDAVLDNLTLWTRAAMREVEKRNESAFECELLFQLGKPLVTATVATPLIKTEELKAAMADAAGGAIRFELAAVFPNFKFIRLRAVGLSFVPVDDKAKSCRASAVIFPPEQPFGLAAAKYRRPPIFLGGVKPFAPDAAPDYVRNESVHNLDPRSGSWEIRVLPSAISGTSDVKLRGAVVSDLVLHLQVICEASHEPTEWK